MFLFNILLHIYYHCNWILINTILIYRLLIFKQSRVGHWVNAEQNTGSVISYLSFFSPVAFLFLNLAACVTYTQLLTTIILFINLIKWILHYALSKKLITLPKSAKETPHNGAYRLEFIELLKALLWCNLKYYHVCVSNLSSCQTSCTSVVHKYD